MAENAIVNIVDIKKSFAGVQALNGVSFSVPEKSIFGLIGPNGAGKTTLIAQLSGMLRPDRGRIRFGGADITRLPAPERAKRGLARSFQITSIFKDFTCAENVALGIQTHAGHSFRFWKAARTDPELQEPARGILEEVGLAHRADDLAGNLAHGEQRQLEIAMVLATGPKLLLLDEPMAGMGPADSERMTAYLQTLKSKYSILLVEHDMDAVFALADRITVLVYGRAIASGAPEEIRANEEVRDAYLGES